MKAGQICSAFLIGIFMMATQRRCMMDLARRTRRGESTLRHGLKREGLGADMQPTTSVNEHPREPQYYISYNFRLTLCASLEDIEGRAERTAQEIMTWVSTKRIDEAERNVVKRTLYSLCIDIIAENYQSNFFQFFENRWDQTMESIIKQIKTFRSTKSLGIGDHYQTTLDFKSAETWQKALEEDLSTMRVDTNFLRLVVKAQHTCSMSEYKSGLEEFLKPYDHAHTNFRVKSHQGDIEAPGRRLENDEAFVAEEAIKRLLEIRKNIKDTSWWKANEKDIYLGLWGALEDKKKVQCLEYLNRNPGFVTERLINDCNFDVSFHSIIQSALNDLSTSKSSQTSTLMNSWRSLGNLAGRLSSGRLQYNK